VNIVWNVRITFGAKKMTHCCLLPVTMKAVTDVSELKKTFHHILKRRGNEEEERIKVYLDIVS